MAAVHPDTKNAKEKETDLCISQYIAFNTCYSM